MSQRGERNTHRALLCAPVCRQRKRRTGFAFHPAAHTTRQAKKAKDELNRTSVFWVGFLGFKHPLREPRSDDAVYQGLETGAELKKKSGVYIGGTETVKLVRASRHNTARERRA